MFEGVRPSIIQANTKRIWPTFGEALRAFINRRVAHTWDVDDILQEVFYKVDQNLDSLNDETRLKAWLY